MVDKRAIKAFSAQIGIYQIVLFFSRLAGIARDLVILVVVGAGVLTDQLFFLFSFTDILMTLLISGGAVLLLSSQYESNPDNYNMPSIALSSVIAYTLIAATLLLLEVTLGAPFGKFLYSAMSDNDMLERAYLISLVSLFFSFPMIVPNSIFLLKEKIHYQPLANIIFTVVMLALTLGTYYFGHLTLNAAAFILILSAVTRLGLASIVAARSIPAAAGSVTVIRRYSFYRELVLSGVGIGILVLLPYVFRSRLPEFGAGLYANTAIYFKFNDFFWAMFIFPVASLLLKRTKPASGRAFLKILALTLVFSLAFVGCVAIVARFVDLKGYETPLLAGSSQLLLLVAYNLIFSSFSYVVSMVAVKARGNGISTVAAILALGFLYLNQYKEYQGIQSYFITLYLSYLIYIGAMLIGLFLSMRKSTAV